MKHGFAHAPFSPYYARSARPYAAAMGRDKPR